MLSVSLHPAVLSPANSRHAKISTCSYTFAIYHGIKSKQCKDLQCSFSIGSSRSMCSKLLHLVWNIFVVNIINNTLKRKSNLKCQ